MFIIFFILYNRCGSQYKIKDLKNAPILTDDKLVATKCAFVNQKTFKQFRELTVKPG